jgi:hypothetical protein
MPRHSFAFLIASTIAEVSFAWPLRLLIVGRGCFRIYRASTVLASRPGRCDRRHKLGFEHPSFFGRHEIGSGAITHPPPPEGRSVGH